jgi:histidinol-phosphate aminotransferase
MQTPVVVDPISKNGFTRRNFFKIAAGASALASMPILSEFQLAAAQRPNFADPNRGIHIDANENPLGPSEAARKAVAEMIPRGGRYLMPYQDELVQIFAKQEGLDPETVIAYPGSSEPLHYTVLAFTSKERGLVLADPGYEAPIWAAMTTAAPVYKIPLADPDGRATHDVKAMLAATANPGVIYICNPNNPTGTTTSRADIEYVVNNAPKGTIVLIDEAYIHLSDATPSLDFVKAGRNVVVLRTFSKLYGMAGLRLGLVIGRPDLVKKLSALGGFSTLPITAMAAGKASLLDAELVPTRKKIIGDVRRETLAWLKSEGYSFTPSESNCFMLNVRRPNTQVIAALAAKEIFVGRPWPAWPQHVRITVGTPEEMLAFRKAFKEVMSQSTAHFDPLPINRRQMDYPYSQLV